MRDAAAVFCNKVVPINNPGRFFTATFGDWQSTKVRQHICIVLIYSDLKICRLFVACRCKKKDATYISIVGGAEGKSKQRSSALKVPTA